MTSSNPRNWLSFYVKTSANITMLFPICIFYPKGVSELIFQNIFSNSLSGQGFLIIFSPCKGIGYLRPNLFYDHELWTSTKSYFSGNFYSIPLSLVCVLVFLTALLQLLEVLMSTFLHHMSPSPCKAGAVKCYTVPSCSWCFLICVMCC